MFTVRGTARLLRRLRVEPAHGGAPATTMLGDWYGTLVHAPRLQVVIFMSERTLLPVVVPAREGKTLVPRFRTTLADVLASLRVRSSTIEREVLAMEAWHWDKAASRQLLGSLVEFVRLMRGPPWPPRSLTELSLSLARAPCGPIGMRSPDDLTREVLGTAGLQ